MKMLRENENHHHHSIGQLAHKLRTVCSATRLEGLAKFCQFSDNTEAGLWSRLPPAVLENILHQLSTSSSFAAVRLVCKSWLEASNACVGSLSPLICFSNTIVSRFSNLETLSFLLCGATLNYERLSNACQLKRLRRLSLPHSCCKVIDWPGALRHPDLSFLTVAEDLFKRVGIQPVKISDCVDTTVDGATLQRVAEVLPNLTGLDVGDSYSLSGNWLRPIAGLRGLQHLSAVSKTDNQQTSAFLEADCLFQLPADLTHLRLGPVHPSAFGSLLVLTQLQYLTLVGSDMDRRPLRVQLHWRHLTALQHLSFSCYELSPGTIKSLPPNLQSLEIAGTSVSDSDAVIAEDFFIFNQLQCLQLHLQSRLSSYDANAEVLTQLHKVLEHLSHLPHLTISFMDTDHMEIHLDVDRPIQLALRRSARLGLPCAIWKPETVGPSDYCCITRLCFDSGVSLSDESAACLATLRTLKTLELRLKGRMPAAFTAFRDVQHLRVSWDHGNAALYASARPSGSQQNSQAGSSQQDGHSSRRRWHLLHRRSREKSSLSASVSVLTQLQSLESLHLAHPAFGDEDLRQLGGFPQLTELVFQQNSPEPNITSAGLAHLSGLTRLCWLDLVASEQLEEGALHHLAPLTQLHYLDIGPFANLSDVALQALQPVHLLQRICLRICREELFLQKAETTCITNRGMIQFADSHPLALYLCLGNDQAMSFPSVSIDYWALQGLLAEAREGRADLDALFSAPEPLRHSSPDSG